MYENIRKKCDNSIYLAYLTGGSVLGTKSPKPIFEIVIIEK